MASTVAAATRAVATDRVDAAGMMRHLTHIARYVKLSGTAEEAESLAYIRRVMDGYGFATTLVEHDAYISLPGPARVLADGRELKAITHSMSRPSPAGGVTGPLVYVGEGSEADFRGKDVRGCIVLAEGIATPPLALRASRAGAIGQLNISPHEHLHEMCLSPVWGNPSDQTVANLPTTIACTVSEADGSTLREALERGEAPAVILFAEVDTGWRKTPILVAELPADPTAKDEPFILFSGHHDTWYHGVMDNGTANITMMEVARLCAQSRTAWRRGLRLCFWSGHSHGRYSSSAWYADTHWDELERRCAAHVNIDSVGAAGASVLSEAPTAIELHALAADVIARQSGQSLRAKRIGRGGDESFWGIGIPAMFMAFSEQMPGKVKLRHALGWWWHTPDDLLDKIDPENLARDARIYLEILYHLLTDAVLPIDHAAQLAALQVELGKLGAAAIRDVPIDGLQAAVAKLVEALSRAHATWPEDRLNAALIRLSRALVPLDYTNGDRFTHDPAMPLPAWPVLEPLRRLAAATPGTDEARLYAVSARQARNRVAHSLREALSALAE
ncbi:M28 family peptidase [Sabulicella rubraurantiaca]|uniref:M28 family peptidase n=1 Tax=Sabulicella rubraurantiaca TaxID=2811429 RepID=UPI001A960C24|nr:M28 family peptidase [Sabulicella rubraurantiaca]